MTTQFRLLVAGGMLTALCSCRPPSGVDLAEPMRPTLLAARDTASWPLPGAAARLLLLREPMHLFLAEYHRTLVLEVPGRQTLRIALVDDTGGLSRANVYRLADGSFRVRDAFESFLIPLERPLLLFEDPRQAGGAYVGRFDVDPAEVWRFIPASESPELPTELQGR